MNALSKLTELQKELGYKPGQISLIALLGLIGEAGEFSAEIDPTCNHHSDGEYFREIYRAKAEAQEVCRRVDAVKKSLRKTPEKLEDIVLHYDDLDLLKEELGDVLYYLNGLAIGAGTTIEELAQLSHDKVQIRVKTIGRVA